jgi:hypothetical protein
MPGGHGMSAGLDPRRDEFEATHDIHALVLGRTQTVIGAFN